MKPMLASNYNPAKLRFPVGVQPKIDGVRGLNMDGKLKGRSGKPLKNKCTTAYFSRPEYVGIDGELAAESETNPILCRLTSSATSTIEGDSFVMWHAFDYLTDDTRLLPYKHRYSRLQQYVAGMHRAGFLKRVRVVPLHVARNINELESLHHSFIGLGYEGTIIRDLEGMHKEGRSTVPEMGLLRIKDFIEEEAVCIGLTQGSTNNNIAQINELGRTFRSSHAENKEPNGQVGSLQCRILKTSELFKEGDLITVAPGTLTENECVYYWSNIEELIGKVIKFKHFPKGVKNKPRFPQFQSIRSAEDI
jgi:DNA ligase-1